MALEFHRNKEKYIQMQYENAKDYVIPFIEQKLPLKAGMKVLEIGCAEGGVLKAFLNKGCLGTGIELNESRYHRAKCTLQKELQEGRAHLLCRNIYDVDIQKDIPHLYDLIILKDVIEHIPEQQKLLNRLRDFLVDGGHIFFGFPPWQMPFGGHQQIAESKLLRMFPYFHLLPMPLYKAVLKLFKEPKLQYNELVEIKETGISIEDFERYVKNSDYGIISREYYLINPIYYYKFGLKAKKQLGIIAKIPYFRDFVTSCMYYLIKK